MKHRLQAALPFLLLSSALQAAEVRVSNPAEFRAAAAAAKPGTKLLLAGGVYGAGFNFTNLRGEKDHPIIIEAADPQNLPVFCDGNTGIHLYQPAFVELRNLIFTNLADNGLNIDDGGAVEKPESARGIVLRGLRIADIGGDGNNDGIKLSGVWDFRVTGCVIERWGTKGGSAIDMVGCHRGIIESNVIQHLSPAPPNCTGVQGKGGTADIVIRRNHFENAGGRAVNIGGSTGLQFFRPPLVAGKEQAEARNLVIEGNVFAGSVASVAFVGATDCKVRFNTLRNPGRWALRILQETKAPDFVACRNGEFTDNVIVYASTEWNAGGVNIGGGTQPATFKFARNWWLCTDSPERSRPTLPTPETDGVYGRNITKAKGKAGADALRD